MEAQRDDSSECIESFRRYNFRFLARSEWVLLIAVNFPVTLLTPFLMLASPHPILFFIALFYSGVQFIGISILLVMLAAVIDFLRAITSVKGHPIPQAVIGKMTESMTGILPQRLLAVLSRGEVVTADLSMGAQVRGVLNPRLILSGGMLVALIRKDPRAIGIMLHEYAHIENFDSLLPAIMGLSVVEFVDQVWRGMHDNNTDLLTLVAVLLYKVVVFLVTVFLVSQRREYYADAAALQELEANKLSYRQMLADAIEGKAALRKSFFHPKLLHRVSQCDNGHRVLFSSWFFGVYWSLMMFTSWLTLQSDTGDTDVGMYFSGVMVVSVIGLVFEAFRRKLLRLRPDGLFFSALKKITPGRRFIRYALLITGFVLVSYLASTFGGRNAETLRAVGGAVVFLLWLMFK